MIEERIVTMAALISVYTVQITTPSGIRGCAYLISHEGENLHSGVFPFHLEDRWRVIADEIVKLATDGAIPPQVDVLIGGSGLGSSVIDPLERNGVAFYDHTMSTPPEMDGDFLREAGSKLERQSDSTRPIYHVGTDASVGATSTRGHVTAVSAAVLAGPQGAKDNIVTSHSYTGHSDNVALAEMIAIWIAVRNAPTNARLFIRSDSAVCVSIINGLFPVRGALTRYCRGIQDYLEETGSVVRWVAGHEGDPLNEAAHRIASNLRRTSTLTQKPHSTNGDSVTDWIIQSEELSSTDFGTEPVGIIPVPGKRYKQDPLLPAPLLSKEEKSA